MRINQNVAASTAYRGLSGQQAGVSRSMERLSSGLRINRAADDAAGLAISETVRAQTNGLTQAQSNAANAISLLRTAEGGLNETHAILQRMRTLAVQAGNGGVLGENGLRAIQAEMDQLTDEIDAIARKSQFNGMPLLDGSFRDKNMQVGANAGDGRSISISSGPRGAVPASRAGAALWDVDRHLASVADTVTVEQTLGGTTTTASIAVPVPKPATVVELAARLNADPTFSSAFTARTDSYTKADGIPHTDVNLIIEPRAGGYGPISVSGIGSSWSQSRPGQDAVEEHMGGFGAADILFGRVDVGASSPGGTVTVGGEYIGFGTGSYFPPGTVTLPPTPGWPTGADDAIARIDRAIDIVSKGRADIGAIHNGFEHTIRNLGVSAENLSLSGSRIRDADIAKEITALQRHQVLCQASISMLAEANKVPQTLLRLLG